MKVFKNEEIQSLYIKPQKNDDIIFSEELIAWVNRFGKTAVFQSKIFHKIHQGKVYYKDVSVPLNEVTKRLFRITKMRYDEIMFIDDEEALLFKLTWL